MGLSASTAFMLCDKPVIAHSSSSSPTWNPAPAMDSPPPTPPNTPAADKSIESRAKPSSSSLHIQSDRFGKKKKKKFCRCNRGNKYMDKCTIMQNINKYKNHTFAYTPIIHNGTAKSGSTSSSVIEATDNSGPPFVSALVGKTIQLRWLTTNIWFVNLLCISSFTILFNVCYSKY